jgi:hypothetical protein
MNEIDTRYVASIKAPESSPYLGWAPCIDWCEQRFGPGWWYITEGVFEFVDERDYLLFMLRWS